jgi:hypothetical protein
VDPDLESHIKTLFDSQRFGREFHLSFGKKRIKILTRFERKQRRMEAAGAWSLDERVELDVGGKRFVTTVETLVQARYFHNLLRSEQWLPAPKGQPIFVNRCPGLFKHVLRLLLDHDYALPEKCLNELKYYGVDSEPLKPSPSVVKDFSIPGLVVWVGPAVLRLGKFVVPIKKLCGVTLSGRKNLGQTGRTLTLRVGANNNICDSEDSLDLNYLPGEEEALTADYRRAVARALHATGLSFKKSDSIRNS